MRIRVDYVVEVDDFYRRAVAFYQGEDRKATRDEIVKHWATYGRTLDDEMIANFQQEVERKIVEKNAQMRKKYERQLVGKGG